MFLPPLFSLSNELLIEIVSNLRPVDIYACRCTCRRLNRVIINSHLIRYVMRTALSGVFDPLEPGLSLPERLDALERWETAWMEMDLRESNAITDVPLPTQSIPTMPGRGFLSGQYLILWHRKMGTSAPTLYSFLDIHARSSHTNAARWTSIEIDTPIHDLAFASELNLAVAISNHQKGTATIRALQLSTGEPHPLASQPKLEVSVAGSATHYLSEMTLIGDYILYWVGAPRDNVGSLCRIYLVAWKEGWVSELFTSLPGVYSSSLSVLSEEIILLVRLHEPALELCRLSNIDNREKASLETVCMLSLPVLTTGTSLMWAVCFDEHPGHALFSKNHQQHASLHPHPFLSSSSGLSTQRPESRIDMRRHLHSVLADGIVVVLMHLYQLSGHGISRMFDLTVPRRTLLKFSNAHAQAGAAGTATGTGMETVLAMPWEKWGPNKAHILEHDSHMCGGSLAGERRATVLPTHITIRDYNPFRVQRALDLFGGAEKEVTLECGSVVKVVKEKLVYRGGECFCSDIETSLPYVKTAVPYNRCDKILMDKDNLVVERTEVSQAGDITDMKFYLHSL